MTHRTKAWALLIHTPASPPANPHSTKWLAGRYCFGHESPEYLEGLRIGCYRTRTAARFAARTWKGPKGERAEVVRAEIVVRVIKRAESEDAG